MRTTKKKKGIEAEREKPFTTTRAVGALIGEEEKEGNKERAPNPTTLDLSVASCDPQGSHSETIHLNPLPTMGIYIIVLTE